MIRDIRLAVRQLLRSPIFAVTAIVSLAIPIALNTTLFAVFNGLLLRPVGGPGTGDLIRIGRRTVGTEFGFQSVITAAVSIGTTLVFGLAPAVQAARVDVITGLKDSRSLPSRRRTILRGGLVAAQMALSVALLIAAILLVRSVRQAGTLDPGFDPERVVVTSFNLQLPNYDRRRIDLFDEEVLRRARELPGVEHAAVADFVPMGGRGGRVAMIVDRGSPAEAKASMAYNSVSPDYFAMLRQPLALGREFTGADRAGTPLVAIVNEAMVQRFWPDQNPLGRRIRVDGDVGDREVVGVVRNALYASFDADIQPIIYMPVAQRGTQFLTLHVRSVAGASADQSPALVRMVSGVDPNVAVNVQPLDVGMAANLFPVRVAQTIFGIAGFVAVLLASAGLYGLVAYTFEQRVKEIGLRVALGATRPRVFREMLGGIFKLAAIGLIIGTALAGAAARLLRSFLSGISPADPIAFGGVLALMLGITLAAAYFAARKALNVDASVALRHE
jgi:predicted permease